MTPWKFFQIYHALDLHLNTASYDVFKYGGRTNVKEGHFATRKDKARYEYWATKLGNERKAGKFCIANFVHGDQAWIWQPYDQADDAVTRWTAIKESMTKVFKDDLKRMNGIMTEHKLGHDALFDKTPSGRHPPIWQMINSKIITPETAIILDKEDISFFDKLTTLGQNDPYLTERVTKLKKYAPFVRYNTDTIKPILKEIIF